MRYKVIDGCPVPRALYPFALEIKRLSGCTYQSIYRGTDVAGLLARQHPPKHTQAWLYANLPAGTANPPGRSTHELRSDGVPYAGPIGRRLDWWQCGLDIDDAHVDAAIRAAAHHGWKLYRPYGAGVEYHHVNLHERPSRWRFWIRRFFNPRPKKHPKPRRKHK